MPLKAAFTSLNRLLLIIAIATASLQMTFPVLTLLFFDTESRLFTADVSMATRSLWYGVCIATVRIVTLFAAPILSGLSDHIGRKKILMLASAGIVFMMMTIGLGASFGVLNLIIAGCIIQGLFSNVNPTAQAVIGETAPVEKKIIYMGYLQLAISIGAFIGPIIGGHFAKNSGFEYLNFSLPYYIAALLALISFFITTFLFEETLVLKEKSSEKPQLFQSLLEIIKMKKIAAVSLLLFLCQISWSTYYQFIPPLLKNTFHYSSSDIGIFVGMIAFWLALATFFGLKIANHFLSIKKIIAVSVSMLFCGLLLTILAAYSPDHLDWLLWLAAIPTAMGDVIAYSCFITLYSRSVESHHQGKVMGLCFIIISLTWAMTGLGGGILAAMNPVNPLVFAPVGTLLFLIFYRKIADII